MPNQDSISSLSIHLFWDVEQSQITWDKDEALIIDRVLDYGVMADWFLLRKHYGDEKIIQVSTKLRSFDKVTVAFLCTL